MAFSQNGWPALDTAPAHKLSHITGRALPGDVATCFEYLVTQYHTRVEPIIQAHSWGWAARNVRGSATTISNHASGTAIDLNAPAHPLGKQGTFTPNQVIALRAILRELGGAIRWGGDYAGRKDEMHCEINASQAAVRAIATKLYAPIPVPEPVKQPVNQNPKPELKPSRCKN